MLSTLYRKQPWEDNRFLTSEIYSVIPPAGPCPNPKVPQVMLAGVTCDTCGQFFIARLRCKQHQCPECSKLRKLEGAKRFDCGLRILSEMRDEGEENGIIKDNGGGAIPVYTDSSKTTIAPPSRYKIPWHVANYSEEDWDRLQPQMSRKIGRRKMSGYFNIRYEQEHMIIADGPLPDGQEMSAAEALDKGIARIASIKPDEWFEEERYGTCGEPHIDASRSWPKISKPYKDTSVRYQMLGTVPHNLKTIQQVFDRWQGKLGRGVKWQMWDRLPKDFQWAIEVALQHLPPSEIVSILFNLQLKPRKGESIMQMVKRLTALWEGLRPAVEGGAA